MFSDFLHYRPAVQAIRLWRVVHPSLIAAAGIDGKAEDGDLLFLWERLILEKGSLKKRSRLFICMLASEYDVWRYRWRWVQVLLNGILLLSNRARSDPDSIRLRHTGSGPRARPGRAGPVNLI